ncbi:MAG: hypothetical protein NVS4B6_28600 [Mycobacterium sp.]
MTHITDARVIGSPPETGGPSREDMNGPLTVFDILRAGIRRSARRAETDAAQSTWDSEGGR